MLESIFAKERDLQQLKESNNKLQLENEELKDLQLIKDTRTKEDKIKIAYLETKLEIQDNRNFELKVKEFDHQEKLAAKEKELFILKSKDKTIDNDMELER